MSVSFNREELAWAAGLMDGEGHIGYRKNHGGITLTIGNTDKTLLERFNRAILNLGHFYGPYKLKKSQKLMYEIRVWKFEAVQAVIAMLWQWLGDNRKHQAKTSLELHLQNVWHPALVNKFCRRGHQKVQGRGAAWCKECDTIRKSKNNA